MRKTNLVSGEYYHIYNRGVDKRHIFLDQYDVDRFLQGVKEFNSIDPIGSLYENSFRDNNISKANQLVNIICFCLNVNHYHLLLQQTHEKGIEKFMHRLGVGYSRYFNERNHRSGALFQGAYKAVHVDSNKYLLYLSAYINLNNKIHQLSDRVTKLTKSSWDEYTEANYKKEKLCQSSLILGQFSNKNDYKEFSLNTLKHIKARKAEYYELQNLLLE